MNAKNGNTFKADAITKQMENIEVAFKILSGGTNDPIGHQDVQ